MRKLCFWQARMGRRGQLWGNSQLILVKDSVGCRFNLLSDLNRDNAGYIVFGWSSSCGRRRLRSGPGNCGCSRSRTVTTDDLGQFSAFLLADYVAIV